MENFVDTFSKTVVEFSFNILSNIKDAVENFKKALELEPDNDSYKSNLQIAEDKVIFYVLWDRWR
jgi:hypothetical protein